MIRLALFVVFALAAMLPAAAQDRASLLPDIPAATGQPHAQGNEFWRKNHMNLLRHDRDLTMREGERDIEASLKGCFDCHAAKDASGAIVSYESDQHFCRSCHDYVAVKVDCFMCHRSTPEGVDEPSDHGSLGLQMPVESDPSRLVAYLKSIAVRAGGDIPQKTEAGQ